ncbi:MAG: endonuclease domain-containing protein [bacterium]
MKENWDDRKESPHIPGASKVMITTARQLRNDATPVEKMLWQYLRNNRLSGRKFRRQHPIGRFVTDFFCDDARLIVELDGAVHNEPSQIERDSAREEALKDHNLHVLRFRNHEVKRNLSGVLKVIREYVISHSYSAD